MSSKPKKALKVGLKVKGGKSLRKGKRVDYKKMNLGKEVEEEECTTSDDSVEWFDSPQGPSTSKGYPKPAPPRTPEAAKELLEPSADLFVMDYEAEMKAMQAEYLKLEQEEKELEKKERLESMRRELEAKREKVTTLKEAQMHSLRQELKASRSSAYAEGMMSEKEPLLQGHTDSLDESASDEVTTKLGGQIQHGVLVIKDYKRRWYILLVYGLMAMTQCSVWNTFGPITEVSERVFGWNDGDISLLTNWGPIAYLVGTFAFSWILDEKGLRPACILSAFLVVAGTGLRCITSNAGVATPLIHIGQFLNGLAGPIAMGGPPALSAEWFVPEQRTTATAIASVANTMGNAVSFILVPYLVPIQKYHRSNTTMLQNSSFFEFYSDQDNMTNISGNATQVYNIHAERDAMMRLMYIEFGWSVFCFLLFFTYFPSKPPLPPSPTASIQRLEFKSGVKKLARNPKFWLICFTYGLALGVMGCFNGVLDVNLKDHNITPKEAGWIGFIGTVAGCVVSLIVAAFADKFSKHMKWFLVVLFILGGGCFLVFALALINIIPDLKVIIYISNIMGNIIMYATIPLFFEMACEVTYPVAEGVTTLVLTLANNIFGLLFLFIQMIPRIGTMWENWSLLGGIFVCVPVLLMLKENYNRLTVDESSRPVKVEVNIEHKQD